MISWKLKLPWKVWKIRNKLHAGVGIPAEEHSLLCSDFDVKTPKRRRNDKKIFHELCGLIYCHKLSLRQQVTVRHFYWSTRP